MMVKLLQKEEKFCCKIMKWK